MSRRLTNTRGNVIELFEPLNSGTEMRMGTCPGCERQTAGYVGRCAAIRELASDGNVISGSNYGHYVCVEQMYRNMLDKAVLLKIPNTVPDELRWRQGTQQDFIAFLRDNQDVPIVCDFLYARHKSNRYRWRLENDRGNYDRNPRKRKVTT